MHFRLNLVVEKRKKSLREKHNAFNHHIWYQWKGIFVMNKVFSKS